MIIPMVLWIFICWISMLHLPKLFTFIEITHDPYDVIPWCFILVAFKQSLAAFVGFMVSLGLVSICYYKGYAVYLMLFMLTVLSYGVDIGNGISILLNTTNILSPDLATTNWESFDDYLGSPWKSYLYIIFLVSAAAVFGCFIRKMNKNIITPKPQ